MTVPVITVGQLWIQPFLDPVMPEFISALPAGFLRFPVGCVGRTPQGRTQERLDPGLLAISFSCALPAPHPSNFPSLVVAAASSLWLGHVPQTQPASLCSLTPISTGLATSLLRSLSLRFPATLLQISR